MALGKQVRKYRERAGWKLETLSFKSGVEVGTINALENRDSSRSKFAPQLAKAFGLTVEQLLDEGVDYEIGTKQIATGEGEMLPPTGSRVEANVEAGPSVKAAREIPVIGEVKGGDDGYLTELDYPVGHGEGVVDYPTSDPNAYALRVRGDSMHPRYRAGEFVVVEPGVEPLPGDDVVVALHDGRKLLKELNWARDGEVQLLSINNHFGPLTIPLAEVLRIQLVAGRVRRGAIRR